MAKGGKKLVYDVSFVTNLDEISKKLKSDLSNIKVTFPTGNLKANEYLKTLEGSIKSFDIEYKNLMKNISQPGLSSKQIVGFIGNFKTTVDNTKTSLQSFKSSISNTFKAQDNRAMIDSLAALEKQLERVRKAGQSIGDLRQQKGDLAKDVSTFMGKATPYSKVVSNIDRHDKLTSAQSKGEKLRANDQKWLDDMSPSIQKLVSYKEQMDKVQSEIDKQVSSISAATGGGINKGTKEEFGLITSQLLTDIKTISSQAITPEDFNSINKNSEGLKNSVRQLGQEYVSMGDKATSSLQRQEQAFKETEAAAASIKSVLAELGLVFSAAWAVRQIKNLASASFNFYQSLDKALTEISVVSNLSRGQVQGLTDDFIKLSKQTGMAIDDIAKASVIFFQQGLNTEDVMTMTKVTADFAKVAGITVEDAADKLTAAVNGFQIGVENAESVADKMNAVAAKSAASINELSTAFEKAASMADQAGVSMDNYLAYIATMVEVTREAPENIGTSLKTIMARFQQVKTAGSSEDGETDVNQVETALKSVGIALRDDNNQLRDLEDVLAELGPMWNTLDRNTQAYLGTVIAGTRQQSRLIALMQHWDRSLELAAVSQNSAGMQALMHAKAMQGLDATINRLTNSWQKFLAQLTTSDMFISILNGLTKILDTFSSEGGRSILIFGALSLALGKIGKTAGVFIERLADSVKGFKNFKKGAQENIQILKAFEDEIARTDAELASLMNKKGTELAKQGNYTAQLSNPNLSTKQQDKLNESMLQSQTVVQQINGEFIRLSATQEENKAKVVALTKAQEDNKIAMVNTSAVIATTVLGIVMTLVTALGGLDSSLGQLAIGVTAMAGAFIVGLKLMDKALWASQVGAMIGLLAQALALAVAGIAALVSAFKTSANKIADSVEKTNDKLAELKEQFIGLQTGVKATKELADQYDTLASKIALTTEEQQKLNETVQSLADTYGLEVLDAGNGKLSLNRTELSREMAADAEKLKKVTDEIYSEVDTNLKETTQTKGFDKFVNWFDKNIGKAVVSSIPIVGSQMGDAYEGQVDEWYKQKEDEALKKGLDASIEVTEKNRDMLMNVMGDLADNINESSYNNAGELVASQATKTNLQQGIKESAYTATQEKMKGLSKDEVKEFQFLDEVEKKYAEYKATFGAELEDIAAQTQEWTDKADEMTFGETADAVDKYLTDVKKNTGATAEEIATLRKSIFDNIYGDSSFNLSAYLDTLNTQISTATGQTLTILQQRKQSIEALTGDSALALNELGLFDSGNESIIDALHDKMGDINTAFQESGDEGAKALYAGIQEGIDNGSISGEALITKAKEIQDAAFESMSYSSGMSWAQITDELNSATESLQTLNELAESLAENGSWTLDEFEKLAGVLDSIDVNVLDPDSLQAYTSALDNLQLGFDATTGAITANGSAVEALQQIEAAATKATIQATINKLKAKDSDLAAQIALVQAEIDTNTNLIKFLKDNAGTQIKIEQLKTQAGQDYVTNVDTAAGKMAGIYDSMTKDTTTWSRASIGMIAAVGKAMNQLVTNKVVDTDAVYSELQSAINGVKSTGWGGAKGVNWKDVKTTDGGFVDVNSAIAALESYNAKVQNTKNSLEAQRKTIQTQISLLTQLSTSDLTKLGTKGAKEVEAYVRQLNEVLNILRKIEKLDHRLTILGSYKDIAIGKQYAQILLQELDIIKQQKVYYKQLYDLQKQEVNRQASSILSGSYRNVFSFLEDGSIQINMSKYTTLSDKAAEAVDDLYASYQEAFESMVSYHETAMQYWQDEIDTMQERVDTYLEAENEILEAVKKREKDILDVKLEAVDKEIEAINKAAEARKKAREDESNAKEISKLQTDLQRALMDTSAGSATKILEIQEQIKEKQKDMADGSFDQMVDDEVQAREDQKEAEQEAFDERLENMQYYWDEVDRIMSEGTESIMDTLKTYSDDYLTASDAEQQEIYSGWSDLFGKIADLGKNKVTELQNSITLLKNSLKTSDWDNILSDSTLNTQPTPTPVSTAPSLGIGSYIQVKSGAKWYANSYGGGNSGKARAGTIKYVNTKGTHAYNIEGLGWVKKTDIVGYKTGGLNTQEGMYMLHGTKSQPEAVLNALQTKTFIKFTNALDNISVQGNASGIGTGSNVSIDSISFKVENMSSEEDGRKAFSAFVDRFNEIGSQKGLSVRLPN